MNETILRSTQHEETSLFSSSLDPELTEITEMFSSAYQEEKGVVLTTKDTDYSIVNKFSQKLYHKKCDSWKLIFASNDPCFVAVMQSALEDLGWVTRLNIEESVRSN